MQFRDIDPREIQNIRLDVLPGILPPSIDSRTALDKVGPPMAHNLYRYPAHSRRSQFVCGFCANEFQRQMKMILLVLFAGAAVSVGPVEPRYTKPYRAKPWGPSRASLEQYPELRSNLYQGDILLPPGTDSRNAIKLKKYLWPNGVIPYRFAANFTGAEHDMVVEAMQVIQNKSCITFVQRKKESEFIELRMIPNKGCYAMIGRRPGKRDPHIVNLQKPECFQNRGIAEHELLHVVGLLHEQARPDRDEHVDIHWENIDRAYYPDFSKGRTKDVTTHDLPYDYKSIMHYPIWAFSKNGKSTITAKGNPNMELGQRDGPTDIDLQKIRRMYRCTDSYY